MARRKTNYVVKYDNDMNKVELGKLSVREAKLMATVCAYVKNKGTRRITMDFDLVRSISGYTDRDNNRLFNELTAMCEKLRTLDYTRVRGNNYKWFSLFQDLEIDGDNRRFTLNVSEQFEYVLNHFGGNFTRFETNEFKRLTGKFAIPLYRLLKQYRTSGFYRVNIDEFRLLLNVPIKYKTSEIDRDVIKPALEELSEYFEELTFEKTYKKGRGRGGQVITGYVFTFKKQFKGDDQQEAATIEDLNLKIHDTEMKIISTKKAMDKKADAGDWTAYEGHKDKHYYFLSKLETLKANLEHFEVQLAIEGTEK